MNILDDLEQRLEKGNYSDGYLFALKIQLDRVPKERYTEVLYDQLNQLREAYNALHEHIVKQNRSK
jgi:hypothetical protein